MVNASQFSPVQLGYRISKDILCKNEVPISTKYLFLEYEIILTIFKFIDLSSNSLSGRIPPDIGSLHGLKGLNLSRNHLIGKIPYTFGGVDQLESLDLSLNNLSGNIPVELQYSYLQVFNVSYNRFEGRVPHGGQLLTFDKTSFLGNAHLCDIPFTNSTCNISFSNGDGEETSEDIEEDLEVQMEYFLLGVRLSYGLGFSIFIGILSLNSKLRKAIFHLYDAIILVYNGTVLIGEAVTFDAKDCSLFFISLTVTVTATRTALNMLKVFSLSSTNFLLMDSATNRFTVAATKSLLNL
ncbi:putative receptor like protein 25 [Cryptomeria japonica]|uniref:putative receptor like protein 25 n=1 Tax=Cryptomeria japonica TaxID=3369 RepID=UPI0027DA9D81|nr:putative receptor like protein 25 [Cryptomeria japonica]